MDHIEKSVLAYPELAERYSKLGELYDKKLWHQLTEALIEFVGDQGNRRGDNFIELYEQVPIKSSILETPILKHRFLLTPTRCTVRFKMRGKT
mmetsp:Transcript_61057/g.138110  ORF Transcript_61057/g.138110 Transcript_61057/m.138110 type:complete len:93 (+) Transcript_61057:67-345(+)